MVSERNEQDQYSEWILGKNDVRVSEGFQIMDFQQTSPAGGSFPVLDPKVFGGFRKKVSAIQNRDLVTLISEISLPILVAMLLSSEDIPYFYAIIGIIVLAELYLECRYSHEIEHKQKKLVESYQSVFLETYGVRLGCEKYESGKCDFDSYWLQEWGVTLRRERMSTDMGALENGASLQSAPGEPEEEERGLAPIFGHFFF